MKQKAKKGRLRLENILAKLMLFFKVRARQAYITSLSVSSQPGMQVDLAQHYKLYEI